MHGLRNNPRQLSEGGHTEMNTKEGILMLKGVVSQMPEKDQEEIKEIKTAIRKIVEDGGEHGFLALSIVAPEITLEKEDAQK